MRNKWLALVALPALLIVVLSACSGGSSSGIRIDGPVPDFQLADTNGGNVALRSLAGKPVVINFWATTCPPCRDEMPHFQALYPSWSQRVAFLFVDIGENRGQVVAFLQQLGLTFPALLDSRGEVAGKYGIQYTPTTLFIDKEGKLKTQVVGAFQNQKAVENHLQSLLN